MAWWNRLPNNTQGWIALGTTVVAILSSAFGLGAVRATRGLPAQVTRNTVVSDSALTLAKRNLVRVVAADSAREADSERIRRQVAASERELRECDKL